MALKSDDPSHDDIMTYDMFGSWSLNDSSTPIKFLKSEPQYIFDEEEIFYEIKHTVFDWKAEIEISKAVFSQNNISDSSYFTSINYEFSIKLLKLIFKLNFISEGVSKCGTERDVCFVKVFKYFTETGCLTTFLHQPIKSINRRIGENIYYFWGPILEALETFDDGSDKENLMLELFCNFFTTPCLLREKPDETPRYGLFNFNISKSNMSFMRIIIKISKKYPKYVSFFKNCCYASPTCNINPIQSLIGSKQEVEDLYGPKIYLELLCSFQEIFGS